MRYDQSIESRKLPGTANSARRRRATHPGSSPSFWRHLVNAIDPVCGMPVDEGGGVAIDYMGQRLRFCTEFCKEQFVRHPRAYQLGQADSSRAVAWSERRVAYFTMEVALSNEIRTYAAGLGVLAGDTLRSTP